MIRISLETQQAFAEIAYRLLSEIVQDNVIYDKW